MLGIHGIWCGSGLGSGSAEPCFWLMDTDPDPTPYPTPFFSDLKDAKKLFFSYLFLITSPQAHYLQSLKNLFFATIFALKFYFASIMSVPSTPLWEKGRIWIRIQSRIRTSDLWIRIREAQKLADPDPERDPYICLIDPDPDPPLSRIRIREAQKHADPDPDPQHWLDRKQMPSQVIMLLSLQFPKPNIFTFFARAHSFSAACVTNSAKST